MTLRSVIRSPVALLFGYLAVLSESVPAQAGGTIRLFPGPERSADQVAILDLKDSGIFEVNGCPIGDVPRLVLLPGRHTVAVRRDDRVSVVGFVAEAGQSYEPAFAGETWRLVDLATTQNVGVALPLPRVLGGEQYVRNKRGDWLALRLETAEVGLQPGKTKGLSVLVLDAAEFGEDSPYGWALNLLGYTLVFRSENGRIGRRQHALLFESPGPRRSLSRDDRPVADLYVGNGAPIIRYRSHGRLYALPRPGATDQHLMELLGSSVLAADSGAGLAMQIASGLSERGVKKIIESRFYRTHAVSGDFVVELEVRDAAGKTQTLTFVEGK